ncbi:forkhead box protein i1 [Plakobranchus ocellatus]|uniref:Forkhead box protein i1 n=1 Tax=Plakobranchus ocellatus TaxID=259542 RepID=A0AAV3X1U7_9GAST|nr:forkhead box protein i1 [Plakobranchus ocellatus]
MQSSNFDANTFQNSIIYRHSPSFDPTPFKVNHAGYTTKTSSDTSNFYQSYMGPTSAYTQTMPGYGCRDPPPYMETSFLRHPSPCFMQNLGTGANYYDMTSSRQMDINDYSSSGLVNVTPRSQDSFLMKPSDSLPFSSLQLDGSFNNDSSINSHSISNVVPVSDLSSHLTTHSGLHLHLQDNQHHSQQQQQEEHNEHKSSLDPSERQQDSYGTSPNSSIYGSVKVENANQSHALISDLTKQSFDSTIPSLCPQAHASDSFPNCEDIKPTITSSRSKTCKPDTTLTLPQPHSEAKQDNSSVPTQSLSPKSFHNHQNLHSSSSDSHGDASATNKDESKDGIFKNEPSATAGGSEETGEAKPTMSYIALIAKAILESEQRRLNLGSIYHWIEKHYPFYKNKGQGWRNSVRHNLSLNDCFIKAGRCEDGKGNYWAIHPANIQDFIRGDFRQRRRSRRRGRKKECDLSLYHVPNGYLPPPAAPPLTSGMTFNPGALSSIYSPYTEAERSSALGFDLGQDRLSPRSANDFNLLPGKSKSIVGLTLSLSIGEPGVRAYRLDEALLRQSMNNPFVKWYHQQQPGVPTTPGYHGVATPPHHGCSAPGLYGNSASMQWPPPQGYAPDASAQNMYPALNSAFPR